MSDPRGTVPSELSKRQRERIAVAEAAIAADMADHMEYLCEEIARPLRLNDIHDLYSFLLFMVVLVILVIILAYVSMLM